jgi:tRNA/tmRNA/rRNA uracil-C5-methylase (TrmA/RlmC/RlmD family)
VARYQGRVVFVRHTLPGEVVMARVTEAKASSKFWRADAVEVLTASPDRVEAPCPLAGPGRCGGCDWQHASLPAQRALKATVITEQLTRLAGLKPGQDGVPEVLVEPVLTPREAGDTDGLGWRTRLRFTVDRGGRAGLRRHRSHEVIPVEQCLIADPQVAGLEIGRQRWRDAAAVEVIAPNGDSDPLVVVDAVEVVARPARPGRPGRPGSAPEAQESGHQEGRPGTGVGRTGIATDGRHGNNGGSRNPVRPAAARLKLPRLPAPASVATRDSEGVHQVRGRTWSLEEVLVSGEVRQFRITGTGFWQVHPGAAQTLLDTVLAAADAQPGERAVDLYCGVGLFAAGLADRVGVTGSVLAVESDARAVKDARRSLHDLGQVRFEVGPVEKLLPQLAGSDELPGPLRAGADVVVLDPPRAGAGRAVIEGIIALRPRVIVYVACDPAALARDLATAAASGYRLADLKAFDLFPMTHHVECVATLVPSSELS